MEWKLKMENILTYIEIQLQEKQEPVSQTVIAELAGCSYPLFQKVFTYMSGLSFSEYVRFRKMTLAGYDLKSSSSKVIDIGGKYGYDSPTAFTKAFQQFHGISPKEARQQNTELRVYPKMTLDKKSEFSWKIETKPAIRLMGKSTHLSCKNGRHYQDIPAFWSSCQIDGTFSELIKLDEGNPTGLMGILTQYDGAKQEVDYSIMVQSETPLQEGFTEIQIPAISWLVFDCYGPVPQSIQAGWKFLNNEWFTEHPFKHADCPEIEWYSSGNAFSEDYLSQIWLPIVDVP